MNNIVKDINYLSSLDLWHLHSVRMKQLSSSNLRELC